MKYSINVNGNIVAERDIFSLGGFIPQGRVGGKIANESQLSQDGNCWLAAGDISGRPDVRIKDNAYVGNFVGTTGMHTDGTIEFSGNTLIPGSIIVRNPIADPVNNFFARDSFIGVSMDVLCGPAATTTAFPFEQGGYVANAPAGTAFDSAAMKETATSICRGTAVIRCGKDTRVYIPTGYIGRLFWGYYSEYGIAVYSGVSEDITAGLKKLSHPMYNILVIQIANASGTAMTPAQLLATGAKILGHISGSVLQDIRPESASGAYVMDNSSLISTTDNFGLSTTRLIVLSGRMSNTNMYTPRQDNRLYGTFHNVELLEYTKLLDDSWRTHVNRDRFVTGIDCPLLRVDDNLFSKSLAATGDLVLRNCIVPKATFENDAVNGNVYEDIDFSYANEFIRNIVAGRNLYSSHREGLYACESNGELLGLISYPGNMADTARISEERETTMLDGNILESGGYANYQIGAYFETGKSILSSRVRTGKPIKGGTDLPTVPTGWKISSVYHLDENLNFVTGALGPSSLDHTKPYFLILFGKDDDSNISVSDVVALNLAITMKDLYKTPEITGSAYVGAGVTVRGDVKLIGDPYVNRLLDVNVWERGSLSSAINGWEVGKYPPGSPTEVNRVRFKEIVQAEPGATITCNSGYWVSCYFYDSDGNYISSSGWVQTTIAPNETASFGAILKKAATSGEDGGYIEDSNIPLANVKYLRAFKKRRYITNENQYDRKSPEDILIGPDYWRIAAISTGGAYVGRTYGSLIQSSSVWAILKIPLNAGMSWTVSSGNPAPYQFANSSWDALTKLLGLGVVGSPALTGLELKKASGENMILSDVTSARIIVEFVPTPRIVVPYGYSSLTVGGAKVRMYDNAVLSKPMDVSKQQGEIVLRGDAVARYDFVTVPCFCSIGHSDAIIP